ncbi:hypothetical protein SprV_0100239500 [Sparganum proliferum]
MITDTQAQLRRQGKSIEFMRKQLAWLIKSNLRIHENLHTMQVNANPRQPAPGSSEAAFPTNPLRRPICTKSDFLEVNSRLHDPQVKSQLVRLSEFSDIHRLTSSYASVGATPTISSRGGKKTKEGLCGSQVYEVIKDVYTAWNKGGRVDVYELEAAFTRRLKRSLDVLRKRRCQPDSHFDDSDEPSTEPSSSRPREE